MLIHLYSNIGKIRSKEAVRREPMGILSIEAQIKKSFPAVQVKSIDASFFGLENELIIANILKERPEILGFSGFPGDLKSIDSLLNDLNSIEESDYNPVVVLGGHITNLNPEVAEPMLTQIDLLISGEGEKAIETLVLQIKTGSLDFSKIPNAIYKSNGVWIENNSALTNPLHHARVSRDYLNLLIEDEMQGGNPAIASISTSRGCIGSCSFCTIHDFRFGRDAYTASDSIGMTPKDARWLSRDPEDILDEIVSIARMGVKYIDFLDDELLSMNNGASKSLFRRIRDLTLRKEMPEIRFWLSCRADSLVRQEGDTLFRDHELLRILREAGCCSIFVGVESGTKKGLKLLAKKTIPEQNELAVNLILESGMRPILGFIMLGPFSTIEDIMDNINYIERTNILNYLARETNILTVYNRSKLKKMLENKGLLGEPDGEGSIYSYRFMDKSVALIAKNLALWNDHNSVDAYRKIAFLKECLIYTIMYGQKPDIEILKTYYALKGVEWNFLKESLKAVRSEDNSDAKLKELRTVLKRNGSSFYSKFGSFLKRNKKLRARYLQGATSKISIMKPRLIRTA